MSQWRKLNHNTITDGTWLVEKWERQRDGIWLGSFSYVLFKRASATKIEFVAGPFDSAEQAKARALDETRRAS